MATKKAPGEDLEATLKAALENMKDEELKAKASEVALLRSSIQTQMKQDPEVKQARADLASTLEDYKSDIKGADREIDYIAYLLESRGKL